MHPLEPDTLFASPEITVQRIVWRGGARSNVHEHRMWAVVGVYAGAEVNQRSAWDFAGIEVPYADDVRRRREMFQAMWDLAAAEGRTISDDDRLLALDAIWEGCEQRSRCLTPTETRAVVRAAWTRSHPA